MQPEDATILLADDDAAWCRVMEVRLADEGYRVLAAGDGAEAIALFDAEEVDLALLDIQLPQVDGFGVCEHIRNQARGGEVPVVFLTGSDSGIVRNHLQALTATVGGNRSLTKTCETAELLRTLREVLEGAASVSQG